MSTNLSSLALDQAALLSEIVIPSSQLLVADRFVDTHDSEQAACGTKCGAGCGGGCSGSAV